MTHTSALARLWTAAVQPFALLLLCIGILNGCRPSQQARRTDKSAQRTSSGNAVSNDSLLMVQDKLVSIIDTMSDILIENRRRINELENEVSRLRALIDANTTSTVRPAVIPPPVTYTQPSTTSASIPSQGTSPIDKKYNDALAMFNASRYEEALAAFDDLAHTATTSPLMPNFIYWRGESLFALGSYMQAIESFHDVLSRYPHSTKSDDAIYKIGSSYEKLGDEKNAIQSYERLLNGYPASEYAVLARARLKKLYNK